MIPLELVNAYATIAARGFAAPPLLVLRVRDRNGKVLEENQPDGALGRRAGREPGAGPGRRGGGRPRPRPLIPAAAPAAPAAIADGRQHAAGGRPGRRRRPSTLPATGTRPDVAFVLSSMMRQVVENGTGAAAKALGRPTAAKTGTAQEHRDAWFVGFTPELVAGVWVGFDDHTPLGPRETGAGAALPPWLSFMQAVARRRARRRSSTPSRAWSSCGSIPRPAGSRRSGRRTRRSPRSSPARRRPPRGGPGSAPAELLHGQTT